MRQYRGLTKEGKWVYGWYCKWGRRHFIFDPKYSLQFLACFVEVIPESVGQKVGLKDKNKVEMYFDDIVLWNKKKYVVVWSKTCLGIYLEPLDNYLARQKDPKKGRFVENLMYGRAVYLEIIGNVHQNPDLMETKDE